MKPKLIILVRHGQSQGNADRKQREFVPDYALDLTADGMAQARQAGQQIRALIGSETVQAYLSPYNRTRQTYSAIRESIAANVVKEFEDPRLREQDWGHLRSPEATEDISVERDRFSPFYYRVPDGESGADVYDRVSTFLETLHRDFRDPGYPQNTLIVTHGITLRLFLMRWFHWPVEKFEELRNPRYCEIVVLQRDARHRYRLTSELAGGP